MVQKLAILFVSFVIFFSSEVMSAHYLTGLVSNASNGSSPDGLKVIAWVSCSPSSFNVSDIIGVTGAGGVENTYLIDYDYEPVNTTIHVSLEQNIQGYQDVIITGAGFDVVPNITYNLSYANPVQLVCPVGGFSEIKEVFVSGGSFEEILLAWNPEVYPVLKSSTISLFKGDSDNTFFTQLLEVIKYFIKYIFREPASLVPNNDNSML
ncbi:MAG: hypothetical protein H7836_12945 [Magnetococcus sp. YQC-3]